MGMGKQLIGYIALETKDHYFRGAALVTDQRGIPADFRYTEPVRPTKIERILYGGALDIYLREEVILQNLLDAIEAKPTLWLVEEDELLQPVQRISRLPVVSVQQTQRSPLEQSGHYEPTGERGVFVFQADNISAPLRLTVSEENIAKIAQFAQNLTQLAEDMEIMEPFNRISKAIEAVEQES